MKKLWVIACGGLLLLVSCKNEAGHKPPPTTAYLLDQLPSEWVALTPTDSGKIVLNQGKMRNQMVTLKKVHENYTILLSGEGSDDTFKVVNAKLDDGAIKIRASHDKTNKNQAFIFRWTDKDKGTGNWLTIYADGHAWKKDFTDKAHESSYPHKEE